MKKICENGIAAENEIHNEGIAFDDEILRIYKSIA